MSMWETNHGGLQQFDSYFGDYSGKNKSLIIVAFSDGSGNQWWWSWLSVARVFIDSVIFGNTEPKRRKEKENKRLG